MVADDLLGESRAWPMARALAEYILGYHERTWITELLTRRYQIFEKGEQSDIVERALTILHAEPDDGRVRLDLATTMVLHYLLDHQAIVVEGIRTFLLKEIRAEFQAAIAAAVDAHLLDEEYQAFVQLLKRLVDLANTRQEWVHVRFAQRGLYFEDSGGRRLGDELIDDVLKETDDDLERLDEVLISALVTMAPARITIHRGHIGTQARETLVRVFDGRIVFCPGCGRCHVGRASGVKNKWT